MSTPAPVTERIWTGLAGLVGATGVCVSAAHFGVWASIGLFVVVMVFGAMSVLPWLPVMSLRAPPVVYAGPVAGFVAVVCLGLAVLIGAWSMVVVALLVLTSPPVLDVVRARRRPNAARRVPVARDVAGGGAGDVSGQAVGAVAHDGVAPVPLGREAALDVPDQMDDQDLCRAWRSSFVALSRAATPQARLRVVEMRALYLDELERRAGPAMHAWIRSGARAAGDPSRYLAGPVRRPPRYDMED